MAHLTLAHGADKGYDHRFVAVDLTPTQQAKNPRMDVQVIGHKPVAVVRIHCHECGGYGYETCHGNTVDEHLAHLLAAHACARHH